MKNVAVEMLVDVTETVVGLVTVVVTAGPKRLLKIAAIWLK